MIDAITYNIPAGLFAAHRGRRLIVRARRPAEIIEAISPDELDGLAYVQLLSVGAEVDDLIHWGVGVPVDVVMQNPASEFTRLYEYAKLLENHPVRITIPVVVGFGKAVRLALALKFAVKLETAEPPGPELFEELHEVLDHYLHHTTVARPVEFFHTLFLSFYGDEPATLSEIQEEDPAHFRYVTDDGAEQLPRRVPHAENAECAGCEFLAHCGGYFKWPVRSYDCAGVKTLLGALREAAGELRGDVDAFAASQAEARA